MLTRTDVPSLMKPGMKILDKNKNKDKKKKKDKKK